MDSIDKKVEELIVEASLSNSTSCSLASGLAGVLLMEAQFYSQWPTKSRRENIESAIEVLIDGVGNLELPINLWDGLVGILYALEFTKGVDQTLVPPAVCEFVNDMDALLIEYLDKKNTYLPYGLISGITGLGAYALMRSDFNASKLLFSRVEKILIESASKYNNEIVWYLKKNDLRHPLISSVHLNEGIVDLGFANGMPGIVSLLASGMKYGLGTTSSDQLMSALFALKSFENQSLENSKYQYYSHQIDKSSSRLAWCHGDLGIAFCFASAASVLRNESFLKYSQRLALNRIENHESSFQVHDNGLCHGYAGVMHLEKKLSNLQYCKQLSKHSSEIQRKIISSKTAEFPYQGSFQKTENKAR